MVRVVLPPLGPSAGVTKTRESNPSSVGLGLSPQLGVLEARTVRPVKPEQVPPPNGCLHNLCEHPRHLQERRSRR
jgi:hypothetical protein